MVSDPEFANSLTIDNASSAHYSLTVMTVVAAVLLPVVLLYKAWTYHVFRARLGGEDAGSPIDLVAPKTEGQDGPWARSTRACCAARVRYASCSPPTPRSGVLAALLVLAQAVLLARVVARAFDGASLADVAAPLALLVAVVVRARQPPGASRSPAGARRRACSRSYGSTSSSGGCATEPAALDGAESAEVATTAVARRRRARDDFRPLPAAARARPRRAGRRAACSSPRSTSSRPA